MSGILSRRFFFSAQRPDFSTYSQPFPFRHKSLESQSGSEQALSCDPHKGWFSSSSSSLTIVPGRLSPSFSSEGPTFSERLSPPFSSDGPTFSERLSPPFSSEGPPFSEGLSPLFSSEGPTFSERLSPPFSSEGPTFSERL